MCSTSADQPILNDKWTKFNVTRRLSRVTAILLLVLLATVILSAGIGTVYIPPVEVGKVVANHLPIIRNVSHFAVSSIADEIVWEIRIPRTLLGALVGMCLAMAGVALQGLLRNPLADPYMIGVSSGAALGAGIAVLLGLSGILFGVGIPLMAFSSALVATMIVYLLSRRDGTLSMLSFILAGVVVGSFMWAGLTFIMSIASRDLEKIVFWTMGSLASPDPWSHVVILLPFTVLGMVTLFGFSRDLNVFSLGEESAGYLGLEVESLKRIIIASSALITAAAVSVSGTIGFVGLIVPHMTRRLFGADHRILVPTSALLGASLVVIADTIARVLSEIPIGVITALLGAPFFLYLLRKAY